MTLIAHDRCSKCDSSNYWLYDDPEWVSSSADESGGLSDDGGDGGDDDEVTMPFLCFWCGQISNNDNDDDNDEEVARGHPTPYDLGIGVSDPEDDYLIEE